jgi:methionyl-tRNA formyltransferase
LTHRIVFLGSPAFAIPSLAALHSDERFEVVLVVSQPDRPVGRGRKLAPPPVAAWTVDAGLDLFQPDSLRSDDAFERIRACHPDLLVVVAYGEILDRRMLALAPAGAINVHPSLLPLYRGSSPIPAAIINGDDSTGITVIKLVRRLDAGPIISQRDEPVHPHDTSETLGDRLAALAGNMLPDVADDWATGSICAVGQNDDLATYTREWSKDDGRIDWQASAVAIERLVRAARPWPVAWTMLGDIRVQIRDVRLDSTETTGQIKPGTLIDGDGQPRIITGDGELQLLTVQPAGKREMPARDWVRNLPAGDRLFH